MLSFVLLLFDRSGVFRLNEDLVSESSPATSSEKYTVFMLGSVRFRIRSALEIFSMGKAAGVAKTRAWGSSSF